MRREAAVAGQFYPDDVASLNNMLTGYCTASATKVAATGIMVPHAGYIYSGAIAGKVYDQTIIPDHVILLGPNHHGTGLPGAVYTDGSWDSPLGEILVDEPLAAALLAKTRYLQSDTRAHRMEHSLEVQVPFIQHLNPGAKLVPICLGHQQLDSLLAIGAAIAEVVEEWPEPVLIIASTDMTHFESAESAAIKDREALACVESLDAEGLFRTVVSQQISMCGFMPTVVMLKAAVALGATDSRIVDYGTSGDVTDDYSNVVAYAGALIGPG